MTLLGLILAPQHARRVALASAPRPEEWPDTATVVRQRSRALAARTALADSIGRGRIALERVERLARLAAADTLPSALRLRRDSLQQQAAELESALKRSATAPLAASYRALGELAALRGEASVSRLLDSLDEVERSRAEFGAVTGVDPIYVALTNKASRIGHELESIAVMKRDALRAELVRLQPVPLVLPRVHIDTLRLLPRRDSLAQQLVLLDQRLVGLRSLALSLDARAASARARAAIGASPVDMLLASSVVGSIGALLIVVAAELRMPRVSGPEEAERLTSRPVLERVGLRGGGLERGRRRADAEISPVLLRRGDEYEQLYIRLSDAAYNLASLAVVGCEVEVTASVAINLAAAAALQARSTLLVDLDSRESSVCAVLGVRADVGLSEVISGRVRWSEAVIPVQIGRDRTVDLLTGGGPSRSPGALAAADVLREIAVIGRRYDTVVLSVPFASFPERLAAGELPPAILVAHEGQTQSSDLVRMARAVGATTVRGLVIWEGDAPPLAGAREGSRAATALLSSSASPDERRGEVEVPAYHVVAEPRMEERARSLPDAPRTGDQGRSPSSY